MADRYIYQKPPRRTSYTSFRRRFFLLSAVVILVGAVAAFIYFNLHVSPKPQPQASPEQDVVIAAPLQTFTNQYFKFSDTGKWILDQKSSTANKIVYIKYKGQLIEGQLDVYINQVPIPLYLATARVLPVRIVNNNSFQVTGVSDPCANQYAGAPHRVKEVTINGATMLCDPDAAAYSVVIAKIDGDYRLPLKRANGTPVQMVITYLNQKLDPDAQSILNIASGFQAL